MRRLAALACLVALFLVAGCDDDRKPMPMITIVVLTQPDRYLVNDQQMDLTGLEAELRRIAEDGRRKVTGQVRAQVSIAAEQGRDYYRTQDLVDLCMRLGFVNVSTNSSSTGKR